MLAIACDKCRRRFTATDDELRVFLNQAEGKKFALVLCPHCGKNSKIATDRIQQALRFSAPPAAAEEPSDPAAPEEPSDPAA